MVPPAWTPRQKPARLVMIAAAYLAAFLVVDKLSSVFVTSANISPWYPPPGIGLALLLIFGLRYMPAVFVAVILSATLVYNELSLGLSADQLGLLMFGTALTITLGYGLIALAIKRWLRVNLSLTQPRDVSSSFMTAALPSPARSTPVRPSSSLSRRAPLCLTAGNQQQFPVKFFS